MPSDDAEQTSAQNPTSSARRDTGSTRSMDAVLRAGLLLFLVYWSYLLIRPLLELTLWAVFLAVAAYPIYEWTRRHVGGRGWLAAIIVTIVLYAVILGPVAVLVTNLVSTLTGIRNFAEAGEAFIPTPPEFVEQLPLIGEPLHRHWTTATTNLEKVLAHYSSYLLDAGRFAAGAVIGASVEALEFLIAILVAGYLFLAGPPLVEPIAQTLERAAPGHGARRTRELGRTIRNIAQGVVGVALIQAVAGGLVMLLFGVPAAGLLTFVALIFGILQIGVGGVFTPVAIWSLFVMDPTKSIPLTAILIALTFLDNYLRPLIMAKGTDVPPTVMFFGTVGGIALHGPIGLFVGPIVLGVMYSLVSNWSQDSLPEN